MTDQERLAEIESELGKITQGEWKIWDGSYGLAGQYVVAKRIGTETDTVIAAARNWADIRAGHTDFEFIVKAPSTVRWLVGRVREQEEEIEDLKVWMGFRRKKSAPLNKENEK